MLTVLLGNGHKLKSLSEQARGWRGAEWKMDRDEGGRKRNMGSFARGVHPSTNQPWASSKNGCVKWRHLRGGGKNTKLGKNTKAGFSRPHTRAQILDSVQMLKSEQPSADVYLLSRYVRVGA